jgi:hypothetical protein
VRITERLRENAPHTGDTLPVDEVVESDLGRPRRELSPFDTRLPTLSLNARGGEDTDSALSAGDVRLGRGGLGLAGDGRG